MFGRRPNSTNRTSSSSHAAPSAVRRLTPIEQGADYDEDEALRLVEEISFVNQYDLSWDPRNLDHTKHRLQHLEDMVNEHISLRASDCPADSFSLSLPPNHNNNNNNAFAGTRISEAELRELFGVNFPDFDAEMPFSSSPQFHDADSLEDYGRFASLTHSHTHSHAHAHTRREQLIHDSLDAICKSLRWYQNKIVHEIKVSHETTNLQPLLELNDRVSAVLDKAEAQALRERDSDFSRNDSQQNLQSLYNSPLFGRIMEEESQQFPPFSPYPSRSGATSRSVPSTPRPAPPQDRITAIMNAVYAVHRGGSADETLAALQSLAELAGLCDTDEKDPLTDREKEREKALRAMSAAGALPTLLGARTRAEQWPAAELQLGRLVALLAGFEQDWALLQRSASSLLETLCVLQLKTHELQKQSFPSPSLSVSLSAAVEVRALVTAAAAKLSMVLAQQWREMREDAHTITPRERSAARSYGGRAATLRRENERFRDRESEREAELLVQLQALLNLLCLVCDAEDEEEFRAETAEPAEEREGEKNLGRNNDKDVDLFLRSRYGLSLEDLLFGCAAPSLAMQRQSAAVLSSFALLSLAEVPQCRVALVSHGALSLLQRWLQRSTSLAGHVRRICVLCEQRTQRHNEGEEEEESVFRMEFDDQQLPIHSNKLNNRVDSASHFQGNFFAIFGPSLELLDNTATAMLMLCGSGSAGVVVPPSLSHGQVGFAQMSHTSQLGGMSHSLSHTLTHTLSHTTSHRGAPASMVEGWIETQIRAQSLPETVVSLLLAATGTEGENEAPSSPPLSPSLPRSTLPVRVTAHLTQFLLQLLLRSQARPRISLSPSVSLSAALAVTLQATLAQWAKHTQRERDQDSQESMTSDVESGGEQETLFERLFSLQSMSVSLWPQRESVLSNNAVSHHHVLNAPLDDLDGLRPRATEKRRSRPRTNVREKEREEDSHKRHSRQKLKHKLCERVCVVAHACLELLAACLSAERETERMTNVRQRSLSSPPLLSFSAQQQHSQSALSALSSSQNTIAQTNTQPISISQAQSTVSNSSPTIPMSSQSDNNTVSESLSMSVSVSAYVLLSSRVFCETLLHALSLLPRGPARLSTLRLVSVLCAPRDKDKDARKQLFETGVFHALLSLADHAARDLEQARDRLSHTQQQQQQQREREREKGRESERHSALSLLKPRAERSTTASSVGSNRSFSFSLSLSLPRRGVSTPTDKDKETTDHRNSSYSNNDHHLAMSDDDEFFVDSEDDDNICAEDNEAQLQREEETQLVCLSLAHVCDTANGNVNTNNDANNTVLTSKLQEAGLGAIMNRLASSTHSLFVLRSLTLSHTHTGAYTPTHTDPSQAHTPHTPTQVTALSEAETQTLCLSLRCLSATLTQRTHTPVPTVSSPTTPTASATRSARSHKLARSQRREHVSSLHTLLTALLSDTLTQSQSSSHAFALPELALREALSLATTLARESDRERDCLVNDCLRAICGAAVNPASERETRLAAETTLVALGFSAGLKDLELCGYDVQLLRDWHALRAALRPQTQAWRVLRLWTERLFAESEVLPPVSLPSSPHSSQHRTHNTALTHAQAQSSPRRAHHSSVCSSTLCLCVRESEESLLTHRQRDERPDRAFSLALRVVAHLQLERESLSLSALPATLRRTQMVQPHGTRHGNTHNTHTSAVSVSVSASVTHIQRQFDSLFAFKLPFALPFCRATSERDRERLTDSHSAYPPQPQTPLSSSSSESISGQHMIRTHNAHSQTNQTTSSSSSSHTHSPHSSLTHAVSPITPITPITPSHPFHASHTNTASSLLTPSHSYSSHAAHTPISASHLTHTTNTPSHSTHNALTSSHTPSALPISVQGNVADRYPWIDRAPPRASRLLDVFHGTRLQQHMLLGLHRIGVALSLSPHTHEQAHSHRHDVIAQSLSQSQSARESERASERASDNDSLCERIVLLPRPPPLCALLLPRRTYQSFSRVARVLQRVLSESEREDEREGEREGESDEDEERESERERCVNENSERRSVSERKSLSVLPGGCESSLCGGTSGTEGEISRQWILCFRDSDFEGDFHESLLSALRVCPQITALSFSAERVVEDDALLGHLVGALPSSVRYVNFRRVISKESIVALCILLRNRGGAVAAHHSSSTTSFASGLQGLALTGLSLDSREVGALVDLLQSPAAPSLSFSDKNFAAHHNGSIFTPRLRHLDLSHNSLGDAYCALLLNAALNGSLESLELCGNEIHRATHLLEVLDKEVLRAKKDGERRSALRYLGLAQNTLTQHAACEILKRLCAPQCALTHLDLADNLLESAHTTHNVLSQLLKHNRSLRSLDLSFNRLSSDSFRQIYLGLLENSTLLLLPLVGNSDADHSHSVGLIQKRLRENRVLYRMTIAASTHTHTSTHAAQKGVVCEEDALFGSDLFASSEEELERLFSDCVHRRQEFVREKERENERDTQTDCASLPVATAVTVSVSTHTDASDAMYTATATAAAVDANAISISTTATATVMSEKESAENTMQPTQTLHVLFSAPLAGFDRSGKAHPLEALDHVAERDALIQVFREAQRDVHLHFDFATADALRTLLSLGSCRALHFSGHGLPRGLCFEDGRAGLHVMNVQQLSDLLAAGGLVLEFVFVSACFSREIGETFVKAGVQHVVCVKIESKIQDTAAMAFTRAFYIALLSGKTVRQSFDIAKQALLNSPYVHNSAVEGEKFILLPEDEAIESEEELNVEDNGETNNDHKATKKSIHDRAVFPQHLSRVVWPAHAQCTIGRARQDFALALSLHRLPSPPADFEGREIEQHSTVRLLLERKLVSLVGRDGVGKSALAATVCAYLAQRESFVAIVYCRVQGCTSFVDFVQRVQRALCQCGNNAVAATAQRLVAEQRERSSSATGTGTGTGAGAENDRQALSQQEELVFRALEQSKALLVLDHLDDLLSDFASETTTDLRLFLSRLFECCHSLHVLNVSCDTLQMHYIQIAHVAETPYKLGPLGVNSAVRLFARLAPCLATGQAKHEFISALLPRAQLPHVREISRSVLERLGDGHPAKIVHLACESSPEKVEELQQLGLRWNQMQMQTQSNNNNNSNSSHSHAQSQSQSQAHHTQAHHVSAHSSPSKPHHTSLL